MDGQFFKYMIVKTLLDSHSANAIFPQPYIMKLKVGFVRTTEEQRLIAVILHVDKNLKLIKY